jgi:L-lactate utilization protein LutC
LHERGGYGGSRHSVVVPQDAPDLADLSHSHGDGARYAVEVAQARSRAETPAARAAKLRLRQALNRFRRVCAQAMRQRMHTEMADLAAQIRKMHDRDAPPR